MAQGYRTIGAGLGRGIGAMVQIYISPNTRDSEDRDAHDRNMRGWDWREDAYLLCRGPSAQGPDPIVRWFIGSGLK